MSYISLFNENVLDMVNVSLNGVGADNLIYSNNNNNLDAVTIGAGLTFSGGTLTNTVTNTDNITEGKNNLFFTDVRAQNATSELYESKITAGTTSQYWRGDKTFSTLDTLAVTENTNLYFTNARAQTALSGLYESPITSGTTAQYWRGDKTWQTLNQAAVAGLTTTSDVTHNSLTLSGLTANSIIGIDGTKKLKSVALSGLTYDGTTLSTTGLVTSITGTANQVLANSTSGSAQTGAVTLTLPQNIHTTATPTFGGLTLGTLSGILKASAGVISGSATTDDLTEGKTNLYFTNARAVSAMSGLYESPIAAGTTSQYWRGDKTWQTLNQAAVAGLTTTDSPTFDKLTVTKGIINTGTGSNGSIAITTNSITAINTANLKNIYIGSYGCGNNNITGSGNFLFGNYCGTGITNGSNNILIGNNNLYTMTDGNTNYIVGSNGQTTNISLHHICQLGSSGNAGNNCVNIGHHANNLGTGDYNTSVGQWSLKYQTSGTNNTALGYFAAYGGATAASNSNTYIGAQCGYALAGANYNTGVGSYALYSCSTGSNNTSIGYYAGRQCGTGSSNVFIGYQAGYNDLNPSNKLYISNSSTSTPLIYGDFSTAVLTVNNNIIVSGLTASSLVATDANKQLTSTVSGLSPTFTGLNLSGLTASKLIATDGSKNLTTSVTGLTPTFTGLNLSGLTASSLVATDGSKNLTSSTSGLSPNFAGMQINNLINTYTNTRALNADSSGNVSYYVTPKIVGSGVPTASGWTVNATSKAATGSWATVMNGWYCSVAASDFTYMFTTNERTNYNTIIVRGHIKLSANDALVFQIGDSVNNTWLNLSKYDNTYQYNAGIWSASSESNQYRWRITAINCGAPVTAGSWISFELKLTDYQNTNCSRSFFCRAQLFDNAVTAYSSHTEGNLNGFSYPLDRIRIFALTNTTTISTNSRIFISFEDP